MNGFQNMTDGEKLYKRHVLDKIKDCSSEIIENLSKEWEGEYIDLVKYILRRRLEKLKPEGLS